MALPTACSAVLRSAMEDPNNIRCVCLLGGRGHGKSTLAGILTSRFGVAGELGAEPLAEPEPPSASTTQLEVHTLLQDSGGDASPNRRMRKRCRRSFNMLEGESPPGAAARQLRSVARMPAIGRRLSRSIARAPTEEMPNSTMARGQSYERAASQPLRDGAGHRFAQPRRPSIDVGGQGGGRSFMRRLSRVMQEPSSDASASPQMRTRPSLVYLMDTPGSASLAGEVAAALRLSDAAVVVVDVAEGVLQHTRSLIRQAVRERVKPVLFINGLDRCLCDSAMTASELEDRLRAAVD